MSYSRDKLGRIIGLSRTEEGWTTTREFTFDAVGQLTGETVDAVKKAAYTYSLNGNRLTATGNEVYDEQDRLIANAEWTYNYNANGYLKKKTHQSLGTSVEYIYDNLGNLLQVKTSGAATIDYQVDGENRRISSRVNGVFENGYLYQDELRPIAELNPEGSVKSLFIYGSRFNSPDLMIKDGVTFRIIHDQLGSPIFVVNTQSKAVVQKIVYDTWGKILSDSNPGIQPFGFAGGLYDGETGLVRFGARDYDPSIGRWLNKDPIRFEGGLNLYGYVGNDPVNFVDPDGEIPILVAPIIGGAVVGAIVGVGGGFYNHQIHDVGDFFNALAVGTTTGAVSGIAAESSIIATGIATIGWAIGTAAIDAHGVLGSDIGSVIGIRTQNRNLQKTLDSCDN